MTTTSWDICGLRHDHTREILRLLERDPVESVFLRSVIMRLGVELHGRHAQLLGARSSTGTVAGVLLLSSLVVPFALNRDVARAFGQFIVESGAQVRNIVGRRETVQGLREGMRHHGTQHRLLRDRQLVYVLERECFRSCGEAALRRATLSDLGLVVAASAAMMKEEVEEDPLAERPAEFRWFIRDRIVRGDEYLWCDDDGVCFRCNLSARTPDLAQIEGVYTPPERRRAGLATRGLSALCGRLLQDTPRLCLYVNDFNHGAIRLYERLGFRHVFDFQSVFYPPA
ncbi:MAG: GNAT family N-acetyltransferase [Candidatus Eiseniibacteriota bacterium]